MLDHWLLSLLPIIQHLSGWIYWIALLAALVETVLLIGLFLPGSTLLLLLGALSAGAGGPNFTGILIFAVAGATLGDNINYSLGRRYGQRWTHNGLWLLRREHFEKAHEFFARHGGKSVLLSRFIPSLKEVAPFVAGTAGMPRGWFFLWNLLGALGWGLQWVGAGYVFARSLALAQQWMSRTGLGIALLALCALLLWYLRRTMLRYGPAWWAAVVSVSRAFVQVLRENPEVQALVRAHPRLFGTLSRRLDRRRFQGLPLTLLGAAILYLLLLFGGLVQDVVVSDPIVALDHSVAEMIAALRTPEWVTAAAWVSGLGVWQVVLAILLAFGLWLWLSRRRAYLPPLLVSVSGSTLFAFAGKLALHRPRPTDAAVHVVSYAFPSAHATISVSLYGFLAYVWLREVRRWPARVNIFFAWALLALMIGASRLVLDVHFLSDILGGYLLGGMWLLVAVGWMEWTQTRTPPSGSPRMCAFVMPLALVFVGAVYVATALLYPPQRIPAIVTAPTTPQWLPQAPAGFLKNHLPQYVHTALGARVQPLSLALLTGNAKQLRAVLRADGWHEAGPMGAGALLRLAREGLNAPRSPTAPLFWDGELYAMAFNRAVKTASGPHVLTIVVWPTPYRSHDGQSLWVAIVRAYSGMHWYPARRLLPDLDAAREQTLYGLQQRRCLAATQSIPWVDPQVGQTFTQDAFFTRGQLSIVKLRTQCLS